MPQCTSGWRSLLSLPGLYALSQNLLVSIRYYNDLIQNYIRPEKGMRILDVGCGPAHILDYLPENIDYVGVDLSREYIDAARNKFAKRAAFYCLPVESLGASGLAGFDLVTGLSLLHHLDDDQARNFFAVAAKLLNEDGRCLTVDPCLVPGQHPVARLLIRMDRGQNVRTAPDYAVLAEVAFPHITHLTVHNKLRIPYSHHIMECRKKQPGNKTSDDRAFLHFKSTSKSSHKSS